MIAEVKKLVLYYDASIDLSFGVLAMCPCWNLLFPNGTSPVPHEIIPEMSWLLH